MTRAQHVLTWSVIAAIVAFTVAVKILASNTTPPPIELPPGATALPAPVLQRPEPLAAVAEPKPAPSVPNPTPAGVPPPIPTSIAVNPPVVDAGGPRLATAPPAPAAATATAAVVAAAPAAVAEQPAVVQPLPTPETDRREALEAERREQANGAVNSLIAAQRQLSTGDTAGIDQALSAASASMNAVGQGALQQARTALANKDLTGASLLINQAVLTASATPPVQ